MHSIEFDYIELLIYVVLCGYKHVVKPWMILVMNIVICYFFGWVVIFGRPTVDEVRVILVQSMMMRYVLDGMILVGGRPV